jgi:hypothetical protein
LAKSHDLRIVDDNAGKKMPEENDVPSFLENKLKAILQTYSSQLATNSFCQCN